MSSAVVVTGTLWVTMEGKSGQPDNAVVNVHFLYFSKVDQKYKFYVQGKQLWSYGDSQST